jgi:hypothetical protein
MLAFPNRFFMRYPDLISVDNLTLAWRRITTGSNLQYKQHFRPLYHAYEAAAKDHIARLHERLIGGWMPSSPTRIFMPKPSGLQRPLSLLKLEDQIVLQAFANLAAERIRPSRVPLNNTVVFSNILNSEMDSIFFFRDWRRTYSQFEAQRFRLLSRGLKWIANFDLAAFYDTISHEVLIRQLAPRASGVAVWETIRGWLKCWSTGSEYWPYDHGIPQGPIASDLLAEVILNGVDRELVARDTTYVRYADDITIFARTRADVQDAAIQLEQVCRAHGLIPQVGKFAIRQVTAFDPKNLLPSVAPPDQSEHDGSTSLSTRDAEDLMTRALSGRPQRVVDKTIARYVLYRAPRSARLKRIAIRLLSRHPEHIDAVYSHLARYDRSRELEDALVKVVKGDSPYAYVRGACWTLLAGIASVTTLRHLRAIALERISARKPFEERIGAFRFLLACQELKLGKVTHRASSQPLNALVQLIPEMPDEAFTNRGVVRSLLRSPEYEVGLLLAEPLVLRGKSHLDYGLRVKDLLPEVQTAFRRVGLIRRRINVQVDQVSDILAARYRIAPNLKWRLLLGMRYGFALSVLIQADALYLANPSHWLQLQNSFNDLVVKAFITFLNARSLPGNRKLKNKNGELIDLGVLLETAGPFAQAHPNVALGLRYANTRRNALPASHPLEKKKGLQTRHLRRSEQRSLARDLATSYHGVISYFDANR